jgi:hypothetical protein
MPARLAAIAVIAAVWLLAPPAGCAQSSIIVLAQGAKMGIAARGTVKGIALLERLRRMTPAQRQRFLNNVPPERRRVLEQRLREVDRMSPEQRRLAARSLANFQNLPEERRMRVRRLYNVLLNMPQERQELLRLEVRGFDEMEHSERKARMESDEFRDKYSPMERRWLAELTKALYAEDE